MKEDEHLIHILIGGDLLGLERITGAKMLRKGCNQASERFDNMSEVAEFWHAKQAFLGVSLCNPIKMKSTIKYLCIDYFWNWERWNNIFSVVI